MVHRLIRLFIETGTITGEIPTLSLMIFSKLVTATVAIINFILFLLPGHPTYWQATIGILGKLYSNTMMIVLNNRIAFKSQDDSIMSNEHLVSNPGLSRRYAFDALQGGISVTREQWTAPHDGYKIPVSIHYPSFPSRLILMSGILLRARSRLG